MDCDRVHRLLNAYLDGELDLLNSLDITDHLPGCPACSQEYQTLAALHTLTSDPELYHPAPAGLEARVRAALDAETARQETARQETRGQRAWRREDAVKESPRPRVPASPRLAFPLPALALAAILLLALGFFASSLLARRLSASPDAPSPAAPSPLVQQIETAHLRSLMADHLTDVASSNQHTVKPWFNGKLDYSPPVVDLAAQGYPLTGGRLDYLDNRPVAALVYRRSLHIINLFIWPATEQAPGLQSAAYNGYHVFHWTQSGMNYWAVSDLNEQELQDFVRLVQGAVNK